MLYLDQTHVLNQQVLAYLTRSKEKRHLQPIAAANSVPKPYLEQGSHPDIVERVWDELGAALPEDCRCLVYGTPALVHPKTGILLAFCNGTTYCLRLTEALVQKALQAGAKTWQKWAGGSEMDTQRDLGADWVFGGWLAGETGWCSVVYAEISKP